MSAQPANDIRLLNDRIQQESAFLDALFAQAGQVIVGQKQMIERLMIGLITGGHVLLEGVPGLAKTLTVKTLGDCLQLSFKRIQFTPALLESMQEKQVTIGDQTFPLPAPFLVMATENPIEQEGTYPLPEAQVDRFMLKVRVGYPSRAEELMIMDRVAGQQPIKLNAVVTPEQLLKAQKVVSDIYIDPKVKDYIVSIVFATRDAAGSGLKDLTGYIDYGASPRATIYLNLAARAHAFLRHRGFVTPEDVKAIAYDVLRHRVSLTYEAEAENLTSEKIIQRILEKIEVP